jgi:hypothetical protein
MMANKKNRKKSRRSNFIAVDVWRSQFGPVSVRAIFDIYRQKFNVEIHNMKDYSFQDCVNGLRKLENPDYISPQETPSYIKVN